MPRGPRGPRGLGSEGVPCVGGGCSDAVGPRVPPRWHRALPGLGGTLPPLGVAGPCPGVLWA